MVVTEKEALLRQKFVLAADSELITSPRVRQASVWLEITKGKTEEWLSKLGIDKTQQKTVVVNTSNPSISFGGATINGELTAYATKRGQQDWENFTKEGKKIPGEIARQLKEGEFAVRTFALSSNKRSKSRFSFFKKPKNSLFRHISGKSAKVLFYYYRK